MTQTGARSDDGRAELDTAESSQGMLAPPLAWLTRHRHLIRPGGELLDVGCGAGRHLAWGLAHGFGVTGIDRDLVGARALPPDPRMRLIEADLEAGRAWPTGDLTFDVVVVANYLHRPLFPQMIAAVGRDGVLVYETYAEGHQRFGRPRRADFLLQPGELLAAVAGRLTVAAYHHGPVWPADKSEACEPVAVRQGLVALGPEHPACNATGWTP